MWAGANTYYGKVSIIQLIMKLSLNRKTGQRSLLYSWANNADPQPGMFFGVAEQNSCLEGFEPKDQKEQNFGNWTRGCARKMALRCDMGDRFFKFERIRLPDYSVSLGNMTVSQCESKCRDNCSCTAYAYANLIVETKVQCMNWFGDLVDLNHNAFNGKDLYVRLHGSDQVSNGKTGNLTPKRRILIAIAAATISTGLLCISIMYHHLSLSHTV
ncbi:hypothetical protein ACSBR2_027599 [Camellia fascicularis]